LYHVCCVVKKNIEENREGFCAAMLDRAKERPARRRLSPSSELAPIKTIAALDGSRAGAMNLGFATLGAGRWKRIRCIIGRAKFGALRLRRRRVTFTPACNSHAGV
jgi:hypothetical protein